MNKSAKTSESDIGRGEKKKAGSVISKDSWGVEF